MPLSEKAVGGGLAIYVGFTIAFPFLKENCSAASSRNLRSIWKSENSSTLEEDPLEYILAYFLTRNGCRSGCFSDLIEIDLEIN